MLKAPVPFSESFIQGCRLLLGTSPGTQHTPVAGETGRTRARPRTGDRGWGHTRFSGLAGLESKRHVGNHRKPSAGTIKLQSNFLIAISATQKFLQKAFTKGKVLNPRGSRGWAPWVLAEPVQCPAEQAFRRGSRVGLQGVSPHHKLEAETRLAESSGLRTRFNHPSARFGDYFENFI